MRTSVGLFVLLVLFVSVVNGISQTNPGTDSLKHQWTFDDGTVKDDVTGTVNGTLLGAASIINKSLNTEDGGYVAFSASAIGVNSYAALTTEVWFRSASGLNSGNTMISYFGDADVEGWMGTNYIYTSPSNGGNCRLAISTGNTTEPWSIENGVNRSAGAIDDGQLHHLVSVVDATSLTMYVDGVNVGTTALTGTNLLSGVSTANAFLCKSGYSGDPTWRGMINKYSIYNKALSADEILFLFQLGAESSVSINASVSSLSFDEINTISAFSVSGSNLSDSIVITVPEGVLVNVDSIAPDAVDFSINVTYDGITNVNGIITLTSDTVRLDIPVKASVNTDCFNPLFTDITNLIPDPFMNSISSSWGKVSVVSGVNVYCGSRCVKIAGTEFCYPNGGSVATNSIKWYPNITYRFRAMVKTIDGTFNMGVQNANVNGKTGDYNIPVPNTNGEWALFDASFTAGSSPTSGVAFFNNCGSSTGLVAYIDNWELYALPGISTTIKEVNLDEFVTSASFLVTGVNLTDSIVITASDGLAINIDSLDADVINASIVVTCVNSEIKSGVITLSSGSISRSIPVINYYNSDCYSPLYPDSLNLITDPYISDIGNFSGWGTKSINTNPKFSFCGLTSGEISGNGALIKDLTGVLKPDTKYRVKARVYRKNPGNVTFNLDLDSAANPTYYRLIKTAMDSACWYFNRYTPFEANIYVYYSSGIPTAQASYHGSIGFGSDTRYMWVGTAIHEMDHYFGSGTTTTWQSKMVNGAWTGSVANNLMKTITGGTISGDSQHFWPYGINQKEEITNMGGQAVQELALTNAVKVAKAMLVDDCGLGTNKASVGVGVYGWSGSANDIYHQVISTTKWDDVDFNFTTGSVLGSTQGVYFKAGPGYIDNWEMYEIGSATGVNNVKYQKASMFVDDNQLITEFVLARQSNVIIEVFDLQGKLLLSNSKSFEAGVNKQQISIVLPVGMYFVKLVSDEFNVVEKIIK
ncbi:MAG: T9SS type A sorting domain-containing protein [Marinilabiliaceae bacterium]|nr:T9SS type A sorting domain-containing protein [Marinilabiliaceae bacterium]